MSRETPAAHLARLKVTYQSWSIRRVAEGKGSGYTAQRRDWSTGLSSIYAATVPELEAALAGAEAQR